MFLCCYHIKNYYIKVNVMYKSMISTLIIIIPNAVAMYTSLKKNVNTLIWYITG